MLTACRLHFTARQSGSDQVMQLREYIHKRSIGVVENFSVYDSPNLRGALVITVPFATPTVLKELGEAAFIGKFTVFFTEEVSEAIADDLDFSVEVTYFQEPFARYGAIYNYMLTVGIQNKDHVIPFLFHFFSMPFNPYCSEDLGTDIAKRLQDIDSDQNNQLFQAKGRDTAAVALSIQAALAKLMAERIEYLRRYFR